MATTNWRADCIAWLIDKYTRELTVRETAAAHLSGIPARQNQTSIDVLYDKLNRLHIARLEAGAAAQS